MAEKKRARQEDRKVDGASVQDKGTVHMSFSGKTDEPSPCLALVPLEGQLVSADLHVHTTVSDGSEDFEQVLRAARGLGLTHVAFTNHDTLVGIPFAKNLQARFGVTVIGGIEISGWDAQARRKVHVLGYGFDTEDAPAIRGLCEPLLERRRANTLWQMEQLEQHGFALDRRAVAEFARDSTSLYKQHIMATLTARPYGSDEYGALYRQLFGQGGICERDISYVDAREAVWAIKQDGGIAVLAHPGQQDVYDLVASLVDAGLEGIEKYHPAHSKRDWQRVDELASTYGLIRTGGSDYHGAYGTPVRLGQHRMPARPDTPFLSRVASL
ncbi:MAG: PHP domain-containing protein [Coriobacteriales bacterium]|jgi:predicted metal-dependent phosphoesterase TrpH|nr:PHP domain-containing protein [Coriobacteriales bacterium]